MDLLLMNLCNFLMKLINTLFMLICSESNNVLLSRRSVNNTLKNLSSRWLTYFSKVILFSSCVFSVYLPMTLSQFHYFSIFQGCDRLLNKTMSHERKAWKLESVKACGYKAFYTFFVCFGWLCCLTTWLFGCSCDWFISWLIGWLICFGWLI